MAGGGHRGFDEGRVADLVEGLRQLGLTAREAEGGGAHAGQGGRQSADALAVHRGLDGEGVRDHAHAALLRSGQLVRGDGLDLGNDQVDVDAVKNLTQGVWVAHVEHQGGIGDLHRGSALVGVGGNHRAAVTLQGDRHLLAELAGAQEQHPRRKRHRKHCGHGVSSLDDAASLSRIEAARAGPTPLTSAICSRLASRIRFTEPKCLSSAAWRAGPSPGMESSTERR